MGGRQGGVAANEWGETGDTVLQSAFCTKSHGGKSNYCDSWKCLHASALQSKTDLDLPLCNSDFYKANLEESYPALSYAQVCNSLQFKCYVSIKCIIAVVKELLRAYKIVHKIT